MIKDGLSAPLHGRDQVLQGKGLDQVNSAGPPQCAHLPIRPGSPKLVREAAEPSTSRAREADLGRRKPSGVARLGSSRATCLAWSLLQLWYASPLPFTFNVFVLNDTQMRSLHLGLRALPRLHRLSVRQALAARPHPAARTGCSRGRRRSAAPTCSSSTASSRPARAADDARYRRRPWSASSCCSRPRAGSSARRSPSSPS